MPNSPQLITSISLQSLNLAINTELRLVICLSCQTAFTTEGIYTHLAKIHQVVWTNGLKDELKQVCFLHKVPDKTYPILLPNKLYHAFDGLMLHDTLGCPLCFQNGAKRSLQNHMRLSHPNATMPKVLISCLGQYLNKSSTKLLLRVDKQQQLQSTEEPGHIEGPRHPQASNEMVPTLPTPHNLQDFRAFHQQSRDLTKATAPNTRFVSSFLQRTGWYDHVQPYPIPMLRNLVVLPGPTEFPAMIVAIRSYFDVGNDLLDIRKTPELVLQRLNSDNPQKE